MGPTASIVLLQNDPLVGQALHKAIDSEPGLQVAGVANSLAQVRPLLELRGIDLLVADLRVGNQRLIELLRERRERGLAGRPQLLVVAMSADDPHLMQALRHGANGYFVHSSPTKALAHVIRQVLAGESPMSAPIARRLQSHFGHSQPNASPPRAFFASVGDGRGAARPWGRSDGPGRGPGHPGRGLTAAERQMLDRVSRGYLLHEIARELRTTEHSIGLRSRSLYRKLQLDVGASAQLSRAA